MQTDKSLYFTLVILGFTAFASSEGSVLDESCTQPGLTYHPFDDKMFLVCFDEGEDHYIAKEYPCASGRTFSKEELTCLPSNEIAATGSDAVCKNKAMTCADNDMFVVCVQEGSDWKLVYNGSCSSKNRTCCAGDSCTDDEASCKPYTCTTDSGYYPDPHDCMAYYQCKGKQATPQKCQVNKATTVCSTNDEFGCDDIHTVDDCQEIDCSGRPDYPFFQVYDCKNGKHTVYYALCLSKDEALMFKCPPGESFVTKENKCTKRGDS
ncbi:vitellogenin receptor-like [Ischnura elegans]|uniref:vitellogenin receptor-like n=1 Tax=Ischnura elegans TaxID=197161 RepID=UPI001ED8BE2D|nr:vitellogenin receptor-like [Ischnura elegans]